MDTRLLHTFTILARTASFTATAAELHLAQSTVTAQIRALEKALGTRLFDRLSRGAVLTESGRRLLDDAEAVLRAESRLFTTAAQEGPITGKVVVGAGETLCSAHLPSVIATLRDTHPDIDVDLQPSGTADAVEKLHSGRLDIALLLEEQVDVPELVVTRIGEQSLVLLCAPDHPLAGRDRPVTWEELAREKFFLHEQGCSYSDRLARRLLAVPDGRPRLTRFGSIEAARSCATAGLGLTVLPRANVTTALREGSLVEVPGHALPDVPVHLARHRRRWASRAMLAVEHALVTHFRSNDSRPEP